MVTTPVADLFETGGRRAKGPPVYSSIQQHGLGRFVLAEGPQLAVAWLIAETWYKWGSFTLELVGFLATWFLVGAVADLPRQFLRTRRGGRPDR